ncbi:MAG: hypothetical protein KIC56_02060 [Clostridium sp.]|jgi:hypothetical protein|nr:hypothetical protein [Clostridium sp.]DAR72066.1 MAG TPA: Terminase large subunit [Caudoviricetes sp.]DAY69879.1 MAG TPA: Terminase large subunit [Caudoviricetes sp.]
MSINTKAYIENYIKIRDKRGRIISLILNKPQLKYYNVIKKLHEENKPIRIIILKSRQMGFSTETEAIITKNTTTHHNYRAGIIAHKETSTTNIFEMSKLMINYLPDAIRPAQRKSNAKELVFNNDEGTGLDSKIKCMTAGGKGIGRSDTFTALHLSELAFWEGDKKATMTGLLQAVPNTPESMIIIESTANGYEYFKEMWDSAVAGENDFYPLFVGWNELDEYSMPYTGFTLTQDEIDLKEKYHLTLEQLTWRRWCIKNNCSNDINQFKQEYPICPEEAFLSTGHCYFDKQNIINRINTAPEPLVRGKFTCYYDGIRIRNQKFLEQEEGEIKIYEYPENRVPYVIGGDTAGDGSDFFTAHVINNITGKQVAVLKQQYNEIEYVKQVYCLGMFYNCALIGLENNFSTYPTQKLMELNYPNQYVRKKEDQYNNKYEKSFGFKTTTITRPYILGQLQEIVLDSIDVIQDKETLREMLTFIVNEKGKAEAETGYHDDLTMGLAISYNIREQQTFKKFERESKYKDIQEQVNKIFGKNIDNIEEDYGDDIVPF